MEEKTKPEKAPDNGGKNIIIKFAGVVLIFAAGFILGYFVGESDCPAPNPAPQFKPLVEVEEDKIVVDEFIDDDGDFVSF